MGRGVQLGLELCFLLDQSFDLSRFTAQGQWGSRWRTASPVQLDRISCTRVHGKHSQSKDAGDGSNHDDSMHVGACCRPPACDALLDKFRKHQTRDVICKMIEAKGGVAIDSRDKQKSERSTNGLWLRLHQRKWVIEGFAKPTTREDRHHVCVPCWPCLSPPLSPSYRPAYPAQSLLMPPPP